MTRDSAVSPSARDLADARQSSPMMEQYWKAKREQPDALLFFRMGDFYELFHEDAVEASRRLGIALTTRSKNEDPIPMAGVPVKSAESYLMRLVRQGVKVAICEQLTDPRKAKGIVDRGIVRVVTAGTITEENALDARTPNYLASLWIGRQRAGLAWVDLSTGRFQVTEIARERIADELARIQPAELLLPMGIEEAYPELAADLGRLTGARRSERDAWRFSRDTARRSLERHFGVKTLEGFGIEPDSEVVPAAGALVEYVEETQRSACGHLRAIHVVQPSDYLVLDRATQSCLELTQTQLGGRREGSLLDAIGRSLAVAPSMRAKLADVNSTALAAVAARLDPLEDLVGAIERTLADDLPIALREGGLIRAGVSPELDELRQIAGDGKSWMARFQAAEIARTGLPGLKIGFNSVFGYYIEVPRGQIDGVPEHYIRKQTIKTAERYITPELKEYEGKVLQAEERSHDLEYDLFVALREEVALEAGRILDTAGAIAELDVLCGLAQCAAENRYVAPEVDLSDAIEITEGRHPVIERSASCDSFVPNDARLDHAEHNLTILTGPNMAGKSTYIRQVALIVLLAQTGSFVPAAKARIGVCDRIFTRVGSGDDISRGSSTFMVEMVEIANILNNATEHSLVVLDEVGRGTSTFDGLALAWAIAEHIRLEIGARTIFATHYHQLTELAGRVPGVANLNVAVREWGDEIVFLHKIVAGGTDRSYGIHVARLAGVPRELLERAKELLHRIEEESGDLAPRVAGATADGAAELPPPKQLTFFAGGPSRVEKELAALQLDTLTPISALIELQRLKSML